MPSIDILITILLGLVEGVTEFLPISSTAHLLIVENFVGHKTDAFNVIIQLGAVQAVVMIYWSRLMDFAKRWRDRDVQDYVLKLMVSLGITIGGALAAKKMGFELPTELWPVAWALLVGALCIFVAEAMLKKHSPTDNLGWTAVIWVGVAQVIAAVFPGTSRSGATIIAAMFCGLSRPAATEYSFLLGIPTMFAASVYSAKDAYLSGQFSASALTDLGIGYVVSMVTAFFVVKWLIHFVRANTFIPFAWYRVGLVVLLALVLWNRGETLPGDMAEEERMSVEEGSTEATNDMPDETESESKAEDKTSQE